MLGVKLVTQDVGEMIVKLEGDVVSIGITVAFNWIPDYLKDCRLQIELYPESPNLG